MNRLRYYKPTVGSDHIPDRFAWLDRALPITFFAVGTLMWAAVLWRHFA